MARIVLYHGSSRIIEHPVFGEGKTYNDYGLGFYCTENAEIAKEWACTEGVSGYANRYELATEGLKVLNLTDDRYSVLNWMAILMENRQFRLASPIEQRGRDYLIRNFLPDYKKYDAIVGYRADDSYFSFARAFVANTISVGQLAAAVELGKLGEQYVLKSEVAFSRIQFKDYIPADCNMYYPKRRMRDEAARTEYQRILGNDSEHGIYIRDIIREGMKDGDAILL